MLSCHRLLVASTPASRSAGGGAPGARMERGEEMSQVTEVVIDRRVGRQER